MGRDPLGAELGGNPVEGPAQLRGRPERRSAMGCALRELRRQGPAEVGGARGGRRSRSPRWGLVKRYETWVFWEQEHLSLAQG